MSHGRLRSIGHCGTVGGPNRVGGGCPVGGNFFAPSPRRTNVCLQSLHARGTREAMALTVTGDGLSCPALAPCVSPGTAVHVCTAAAASALRAAVELPMEVRRRLLPPVRLPSGGRCASRLRLASRLIVFAAIRGCSRGETCAPAPVQAAPAPVGLLPSNGRGQRPCLLAAVRFLDGARSRRQPYVYRHPIPQKDRGC